MGPLSEHCTVEDASLARSACRHDGDLLKCYMRASPTPGMQKRQVAAAVTTCGREHTNVRVARSLILALPQKKTQTPLLPCVTRHLPCPRDLGF